MEDENEEKKKKVRSSFLRDGVTIYEQVFDKDTKQSFYIGFNTISGVVNEAKSSIEIDDITYLPFNTEMVQKETVKLPSEALDYGEETDLIEMVRSFIHKYVDLSEFGEKIASYYVLLSWVYDNYETIPYLRFIGDYGTGKSRALKTVGNLCYKPIFAGGAITTSPIFRLINDFHGTLVIDEADFNNSDHYSELVKILNCGYQKGMPVLRTEGDAVKQPKAFDVFSPKLIATRSEYKDLALESRCITTHMSGNPRKDIPYNLPNEFEEAALKLRNYLLFFRFKHFGSDSIKLDESKRIPNIEPRINQITMAILAIVKDEVEQQKIREFIIQYDESLKSKRSEDITSLILQAIIEAGIGSGDLSYKVLSGNINKERSKENGEYPISPAKIGKINSSNLHFDIRRVNGKTEFLWNETHARELCNRYGLKYDEIISLPKDLLSL
jgi:hypothetical protein